MFGKSEIPEEVTPVELHEITPEPEPEPITPIPAKEGSKVRIIREEGPLGVKTYEYRE